MKGAQHAAPSPGVLPPTRSPWHLLHWQHHELGMLHPQRVRGSGCCTRGGRCLPPPPYLPWQLLHWQLRMTGSTTGSVWPPGQGRRRMRMGLAGSRR